MCLKAKKIYKIEELPGAGPPPGIRHGATEALIAASYSLPQIVMHPLLWFLEPPLLSLQFSKVQYAVSYGVGGDVRDTSSLPLFKGDASMFGTQPPFLLEFADF
jgi:hypothetical protein